MPLTADDIAPDMPNLGNAPLSTEPYVSLDYFARELDEIFGKLWFNLGRSMGLPRPGGFVVKAVEVRNASVLVIDGKDGVLRALHNVCSHRGCRWRRISHALRSHTPSPMIERWMSTACAPYWFFTILKDRSPHAH